MNTRFPIGLIALFLFSIIVITGCHDNDNFGVGTIDIAASIDNKMDVRLSAIADSITYIPLETKSECLLSEPYLVIHKNGHIFISDGKNPLLVFDREGNFIRKIGSLGKGPGEYIQCKEFAVMEERQEVYILNANKEILAYNWDGEFIASFKLPHDSYMFYQIGSNNYLFYHIIQNSRDSTYFRFYFTDNQFKYTRAIAQGKDPLPYFYPTFGANTYNAEGNNYAQFEDNDTIYQINSSQLIPRLYLDFNRLRISSELLKDFENMEQHMINYVTNYELSELGGNITLSFANKGKIYLGIIDLKKRRIAFAREQDISFPGLVNDIDGGPGFFPGGRYSSDSWIKPIPAFLMKQEMEKKDFNTNEIIDPMAYQRLKLITNNLVESDNPILMLVHKKPNPKIWK